MPEVWLNLGCGVHKAKPPWVNVDAYPGVHPDVVADVRALPWETATRVYAGHLLEHLELTDVPVALAEIRRVLVPGGQLCIVGPDYDRAATGGATGILLDVIRAGSVNPDNPDDSHRWTATETNTLQLVRDVFPDAVPVPIAELGAPWPASNTWWQFAILATEPEVA